MAPTYTTHLICAPQFNAHAVITALLVQPGAHVETDAPLVRLEGADFSLEVCAPEAGMVGEFMVEPGSSVTSNELLLTMEIEENPFGFLPMLEEEPAFSPACLLAQTPPPATQNSSDIPLRVLPEAASLAARLGVDLAEVRPGVEGIVDDEAISAHVRDILVRWRKIRRLLSD